MKVIERLNKIQSKITKEIIADNKTCVFDDLPDFDKGMAVGMGKIISEYEREINSLDST